MINLDQNFHSAMYAKNVQVSIRCTATECLHSGEQEHMSSGACKPRDTKTKFDKLVQKGDKILTDGESLKKHASLHNNLSFWKNNHDFSIICFKKFQYHAKSLNPSGVLFQPVTTIIYVFFVKHHKQLSITFIEN